MFDRVGFFDPTFRYGEDTDWVFRAVYAGLVVARIDRPLIRRRIHGANLTYEAGPLREEVRQIVFRSVRERIAKRRRSS